MATRPDENGWMRLGSVPRVRGCPLTCRVAGAGLLLLLLGGLFPAGAQIRPQPLRTWNLAEVLGRTAELKGLRVQPRADSVRVALELDAEVRYTSGWLSPELLYFDLLNTRIGPALKGSEIPVGHAYLSRIWIAQEDANLTRVVFDLNSGARHTVAELSAPPRLMVGFEGRYAPREGEPRPGGTPAASPSAGTAANDSPNTESSSANPLSQIPASSQTAVPAQKALQARPRPVLHIPRVSRAPKLEDFLRGTPREAEARVEGFRQREPGDGVPASQETSAYLSYDDKNLYVVFVCKDEPGKIRAHMGKREEIENDDQVAIYLDTFSDHQRAYVFSTNPLGIQSDGILAEGDSAPDLTFDTLWYSDGRLTEDGYIVWIAIPFKSLRFPNNDSKTWGVALSRGIVRTNEDTFWPYITDRVEGFTQQMAILEGLSKISPGHNIQLIPYTAYTRSRALDFSPNHQARFVTDNDVRGGLDAKLILRDAVTVDFTIKPDFSNVESNEPQVTINQRFEVLFPEKRPFFLENGDYFRTPENLFFSRRIVGPQYGFRTSGKLGHWALGVLAIDDKANGRSFPDGDPLAGKDTGIGVIRLRRDLGNQSNVGLFVSSMDFGPTYNRVFSMDTRLKLSPNWVFTGQAMTSTSRDLDRHTAGPGYFVGIERGGRHFTYSGSYEDLSSGFNANELGFIPRVDIREMTHSVSYYWRPEGRHVLSFGPIMTYMMNWNHQGQLQDRVTSLGFKLSLANDTQLNASYSDHFELFQGVGFHHHLASASFSTAPLPWLSFSASVKQGTDINFSPNPPLSPFLGDSTGANFAVTLLPTRQLRIDGIYFYTRLGSRKEFLPREIRASGSVFNNHLSRLKVNYQFTKALSLRAILDYNATIANLSLINTEPTKTLTGDVLLTYLLNPATALYIGYTDQHENVFFSPQSPGSLQIGGSPIHPTGRIFYVKLSYLLRF